MRKVVFVLFLGLFLNSPVFSQIERGMWQLQNSPFPSFSSILNFKDGVVKNSMLDLDTGLYREASGVYKLTGSTLVIVMNNVKYVYTVEWYNRNKFTLFSNGVTLIYEQSNTTEDNFLANYLLTR